MTQPSNVRFVMEDRLLQDLDNFQASVDADQTAFQDSVNAQIAGFSGYNYVINGAFDVWQRIGSPFLTGAYCADRWKKDSGNSISIERYTDPTEAYYEDSMVHSKYALELVSANNTSSIQISQCFESNYVNALRGKTVTLSFIAKCTDGTNPEMYFGIDGSDVADSSTATFTSIAADSYVFVDTMWNQYSATINVPYDTTTAGLRVRFNVDNLTLNERIQITNVKLEVGSGATSFTRNGGDLAGELLACQRYYQRLNANVAVNHLATGGSITTTSNGIHFPLKATMRIAPTVVEYPTPTTTYFTSYNFAGAGGSTVSAISLNNATKDTAYIACTVTGAVAGAAAVLRTATTAAYIGFSAEL